MKNRYYLLFKTGDAEIRCLRETITASQSDIIIPIIELTRGRKSTKDEIGLVDKKLTALSELFCEFEVVLDLTSDPHLSSVQLDRLYGSEDGYQKWVNFLVESKKYFSSIIPTVILDTDDADLAHNLRRQVQGLLQNFPKIAYRGNIQDGGYLDDIEVIADLLTPDNFLFIMDCGYITPGGVTACVERVKERIGKIRSYVPSSPIVVVGTSFPKAVAEVGDDTEDDFSLSEIIVHKEVSTSFDVAYGDYGSVNPIRNDNQPRQGWVPRIDVPTENMIYYKRERKQAGEGYPVAYVRCANRVIKDSRFPSSLDCWGVKKVLETANGRVAGASPSYWISVRMNIHIEQRINSLVRE